jgi:hypothetical protein
VRSELYQANLTAGTLSLVSTGYDGLPANGDTSNPAYAGDSRTIAFAGTASNLVFGAVNGSNSAIFTQAELDSPTVPGESTISTPPQAPLPVPRWTIGATTRRDRRGGVTLDVTVPGAGKLTAAAVSDVPVKVRKHVTTRGRHGRRHTRIRVVTKIARRTVTRGKTATGTAGVVSLRVVPGRRYVSLARARHGLDATVTISFSAAGHPRLRTTLPVLFAIKPRRASASRKAVRPTAKRTAAAARHSASTRSNERTSR